MTSNTLLMCMDTLPGTWQIEEICVEIKYKIDQAPKDVQNQVTNIGHSPKVSKLNLECVGNRRPSIKLHLNL